MSLAHHTLTKFDAASAADNYQQPPARFREIQAGGFGLRFHNQAQNALNHRAARRHLFLSRQPILTDATGFTFIQNLLRSAKPSNN
jgi:hypothetical protein